MKIDLIIETTKAMKSITTVQEALSALSQTDFSTLQGVYGTIERAQKSFANSTKEVANTVKDSLNNISDVTRNQLKVQTEQYEAARKAEVESEKKSALEKLKLARDLAKKRIENEKQARAELEEQAKAKKSSLNYDSLIKDLGEKMKKAYGQWEVHVGTKDAKKDIEDYVKALKTLDTARRVAGKPLENLKKVEVYKGSTNHFDMFDPEIDPDVKPITDYEKKRKKLYSQKPSQEETDFVNLLASKYKRKTELDDKDHKSISKEIKQRKKEYEEAEKAYQEALVKAKMGEVVLKSLADVQAKRNKDMARLRSLQKKENLTEDERAEMVAVGKRLNTYASVTPTKFYEGMNPEDVIKDAKAFKSKLNAKSKREPEIQDEYVDKKEINAEIEKSIINAEKKLATLKKEQAKKQKEEEAKQKATEKEQKANDEEKSQVEAILGVSNAWLTVGKTIDKAVIEKIDLATKKINSLKEALKSLDTQTKPSKVKEVAEKSPVTSEENTKVKTQDINDVGSLAGAWRQVGDAIKEGVIDRIALMHTQITPVKEALVNIKTLLNETDNEIKKGKTSKKNKKDDKEVDQTKEKLEKLDGSLAPVSARLAKMAEDANLLLERLSQASSINFTELKNSFKEVNQAAATLKKYGTKVVEKSQKAKEKSEKQEDTPDIAKTLSQQRAALLHQLETSYAENHQNALDQEWIANLQKVRDLTSEIMTMRRMMGQAPQGLKELNSLINSYGKEEQPQIRRQLLQEYGKQKAEQLLIDKEKKSAVDNALGNNNQSDKEVQREKALQYEQRVRYALDNNQSKEESQRERVLQYEQKVRHSVNNKQNKEYGQIDRDVERIENKLLDLQNSVGDHLGKEGLVYSQSAYLKDLHRLEKLKTEIAKFNEKTGGNFFEGRTNSVYEGLKIANVKNKKSEVSDKAYEKLFALFQKLDKFSESVNAHKGKEGFEYSPKGLFNAKQQFKDLQRQFEELGKDTNITSYRSLFNNDLFNGVNVKNPKAKTKEALVQKVTDFEQDVNSYKGEDGFEYTKRGLYNAKKKLEKLKREWESLAKTQDLESFPLNENIFEGVNRKTNAPKTKDAEVEKTNTLIREQNKLIIAMRDEWAKTNGAIESSDEWKHKMAQLAEYSHKITQMKLAMSDISGARSSLKNSLSLAGNNPLMTSSLLNNLVKVETEAQRVNDLVQRIKDSLKSNQNVEVFDVEKETKKLDALRQKIDSINNRFTDSIDEQKALSLRQYKENARKGMIFVQQYNQQAQKFNEHGYDVQPVSLKNIDTSGSNYHFYRDPIDAKNKIQQLENEYDKLIKKLEVFKGEDGEVITDRQFREAKRRIEEITSDYEKLSARLGENKKLDSNVFEGINRKPLSQDDAQSINSLSAKITEATERASRLYLEFEKTKSLTDKIRFQQSIKDLEQLRAEEDKLNRALGRTESLIDKITDSFKTRMKWALTGNIADTASNLATSSFDTFVDLEKKMAGVQQVMPFIEGNPERTNDEAQRLIGIARNYAQDPIEVADAARLWGRGYGKSYINNITSNSLKVSGDDDLEKERVTIDGVNQSKKEYIKNSLAMKTTNELARQSAMLAAVDNFSLEESVKGLEAILSAYEHRATSAAEATLFASRAVDIITKVSHTGQISAQDLVQGIEATGKAAQQAGISLSFLSSMIETGVRNTGRSGSEIGQAVKALTVGAHSKKGVKELANFGIDVSEVGEDGVRKLRPLQDVILDIATALEKGDKNAEQMIMAIAGGRYQYSKLASILNDKGELFRQWGEAVNSNGFAEKQLEVQLNTIDSKLKQVKASAVQLIQAIMSGGGSRGISFVLNSVSRGLQNISSHVEGLEALAISVGGYFALKQISPFINNIKLAVSHVNEYKKALEGVQLAESKRSFIGSVAKEMWNKVSPTHTDSWEAPKKGNKEKSNETIRHEEMKRQAQRTAAATEQLNNATLRTVDASNKASKAQKGQATATRAVAAAEGAAKTATNALTLSELRMSAVTTAATMGLNLIIGAAVAGIAYWATCTGGLELVEDRIESVTGLTQNEADARQENMESLKAELAQREEQINYADKAVEAIREYKDASEDSTLSEEKQTEAKEKLQQMESNLSNVFSQDAIKRLQEAGWTSEAYEKEKNNFKTTTEAKKKELKELDNALETYYDKRIKELTAEKGNYENSLGNFSKWSVGQIEGLNVLESAWALYWQHRYNSADEAQADAKDEIYQNKQELDYLNSKGDLSDSEKQQKKILENQIKVDEQAIEELEKEKEEFKKKATKDLRDKISAIEKETAEAQRDLRAMNPIEYDKDDLFGAQQPQGEWEPQENKSESEKGSTTAPKTEFNYDTDQIQALSNLQKTLKEKYNDKGLDMGALIGIAQKLTGNSNLNLSGSSDVFRNASQDAWDSAWVFFEQMADMFEQGKGSAEALAEIYKDISKDEWESILNDTDLEKKYDFAKNQRDFTDPHNQEVVLADEAGKSDQFMWQLSLKAGQMSGINPDFIYGQFMHETGGSSNKVAMANHNYAGLGGGQTVDWGSDENFLKHYVATLLNGSAWNGITYRTATTATDFVRILKENGYFTDPNVDAYIKSVDYYGNEGKGTPQVGGSLGAFDKIMDNNGLTNFYAGLNGCVRSSLQAGSYISGYFKDLFTDNLADVDNLYNRAVADMENNKGITVESYSDSKAKTGDIVIYVDGNGSRQHAGIVAGTDENGKVINYDDASSSNPKYSFTRRDVHSLSPSLSPAYLIRDNHALNLGSDDTQRKIVHHWSSVSKNTIGFERNKVAEFIDQVAKDKEAYEATKQRLELELKLTGLTESLAKRMDENDALYYSTTLKQKEFLNNSLDSTKDRISKFIKSHGALDSTIGNNFYKLTDSEQTSLAEKYKNDEFKKLVQNYQSLMKSAKEANKTFEQAENDRRFRNGHLAPKEQLDLNIARNDRWAKNQPERKVEFAQDNVKLAEQYTNSAIDTYIGLKAKDAETIAQKTKELKECEADLTNTIIKQKEAKEDEKEKYTKSIDNIREKIKSLKDDLSDLANGSKETQDAEKTMNDAKDNLEELKKKAREVAEEYAKAGAEIATDFFDKMLLQGSQLKDVLKEIRDEIAKIALKRMVFTMMGVKNDPINQAGNIGTILGGLDQRIGKKKKQSVGGYKSNYQLANNPFNSPYSPVGSMVGDIGSRLFKHSGVKSGGSVDYNKKFNELGSKIQINSAALTKSAGFQQTISTALPLAETAITAGKVADTTNTLATNTLNASVGVLAGQMAVANSQGLWRNFGGKTYFSTGGLVGFATGGNTNGLIKGAGTGTSDSILTYLAHRGQFIKTSNGEYIIKKSTVDKVGVPFLDTLNNNPEAMQGLQRYADGGSLGEEYVPTMSNKTVANYNKFNKNKAESKQISTRKMESLLQGLRDDVQAGQNQSQNTTQPIILNTQADSNSVMKAIAKNPRALQNILGGQKKRGFR